MTVAFLRQIGSESGVQLNPLQDNSEVQVADNSDQVFAIAMRATRGRIDRPFKVSAADVFKKLGSGEQIRINALNLAWVHVVEALNNGAYEAVIHRLVPDTAIVKYLVCTKNPEFLAETGFAMVGSARVGASSEYTFDISESIPEGDFFFALKHLECFNDGIKCSFHADENDETGENAPNDRITLRVLDKDDTLLYEFTGSLKQGAKDDYGNSAYLPDVIAAQTDLIELTIGVEDGEAEIAVDSDAYGYDENGQTKWITSDVMLCFDEGGTTYQTSDYMKARQALQACEFDYSYISSGGSQATGLLTQLAQLAYETNTQLRFDVDGALTADAAIQFVKSLNFGGQKCPHLLQAFWCPLVSDDPTGVNPPGYFGAATLNIAFACARNAVKNAKGFARKHYPIAGREWPINRTRVRQTAQLPSQTLSKLAKAKINPCIYTTYTGGGRYVFYDSLTCAPVEQSLRKLIAVADMSTTVDDAVTRASKDYLQLPITDTIKKLTAYLDDYFADAQTSGWLVPSDDPAMGGAAYKFVVRANEARPYDAVDVMYWVRYNGTARQIFVTQTITK